MEPMAGKGSRWRIERRGLRIWRHSGSILLNGFSSLTDRDREIICAFSGGDTTKAVAERFGLSEGRVSQLRRKFERLWRGFQGEAEVAA